jgi:hypothetical protein
MMRCNHGFRDGLIQERPLGCSASDHLSQVLCGAPVSLQGRRRGDLARFHS